MNHIHLILSLALICSQAMHSQELPMESIPETAAPPAAQQSEEIITTPATESPAADVSAKQLSEGEQRLRAGIVMLGNLHNILAGIQDNDSAENAVAPLMRLCGELNLWAQGFTALPPMTETEQVVCEDRYLPIIKKINYSIKSQGERLAAAEYYGSLNLPAALVKLAILNQ